MSSKIIPIYSLHNWFWSAGKTPVTDQRPSVFLTVSRRSHDNWSKNLQNQFCPRVPKDALECMVASNPLVLGFGLLNQAPVSAMP